MAYLAKSDYTLSIAIDHLDEILEQASYTSGLTATNVLNNAEAWGRAFVKSYLVTKYNIAAEFALNSPDSSRNPIVMQVLIDLILCQIHKTINPRDIPELRTKACDDALQWLKDARDGTVVVDLSAQTPQVGEIVYNRTFVGSQPKFISKPYQDRSIIGDDE
jgi:hypothetical protein